ncbi:MAG: hypothetical protein OEZ34_00080 [Spirochaetia bacterium]|nr:hypothetical protein [Spirochaetia bacterium]
MNYKKAAFVFSGIAGMFLFSCGGVMENQPGPVILPAHILSGSFIGKRIIRDRNFNIRAVAEVERSCRAVSELEGLCEDKILTYGIEGIVQEKFKYKIYFDDQLRTHLSIQGDRGSLDGRLYGAGLFLTGLLKIPGENKTSSVQTRWERMSLQDHRISIQRDMYYFSGFLFAGSVETVWQK